MPAYDAARFDPPAPLAQVTLRNLTTGARWSNVPMLLDSGADVTLLPHAVLDRLGLTVLADRQYELVGFDGEARMASAVRLELVLAGRAFTGSFLLIDQDWGIIGRNILNALPLIFDGPQQIWDVMSRRLS
jgi:hypothetical protein